jgi:hypothetical protein
MGSGLHLELDLVCGDVGGITHVEIITGRVNRLHIPALHQKSGHKSNFTVNETY